LAKIIIDNVRKIKVNVFARVTPLHTCFNSTYMYSLYTIVSETDVRTKAYFRFQIFSFRVYVISEKNIARVARLLCIERSILLSKENCNFLYIYNVR